MWDKIAASLRFGAAFVSIDRNIREKISLQYTFTQERKWAVLVSITPSGEMNGLRL